MKIIYFVPEDWFFASHFLPMAAAARETGLDVVIATRLSEAADRLAKSGIRLIPVKGDRRSSSVAGAVREAMAALRIISTEKPDIVHCIGLRSAVLGGISARLAGIKGVVIAPTGLGELWAGERLTFRAFRSLMRAVIGRWLRGPRTRYLFENREDPRVFDFDLDDKDLTIIGGAGVDQDEFPYSAEPSTPPVKVAVVSRMISSKGIACAVEAMRHARSLAPLELHLFGSPDPKDRRAIPAAALRAWACEPAIHWHGHTNDVARVWREHHIALFIPNEREGLPRSLVEAAAVGRPIVTSNVIGCRELVRDGREGFLVEPGDAAAAAKYLVRLANSPELRAQLGSAANARFREFYTVDAVRGAVAKVYRSLLGPPEL